MSCSNQKPDRNDWQKERADWEGGHHPHQLIAPRQDKSLSENRTDKDLWEDWEEKNTVLNPKENKRKDTGAPVVTDVSDEW